MKTVWKKLFCLMLVAMLLVSAVPAAFASGPDPDIDIPVHVYVEGNKIAEKTLKVSDGETKTLTKELGMGLITDKEGRSFASWVNNSGDDVTGGSIPYDWVKDETGYYLVLNLNCSHPDSKLSGGVQISAPSCKNEGAMEYDCASCKGKVQKPIAKTAHTYTSAVTTQPTCTSEGVKTFTCSTCGDSYTEPVAKIAHNWKDGICTVCNLGAAPYTITFKYLNENGTWATKTQEVRNSEVIDFPITPSVKGKRISGWSNEKNATIYRIDSTYNWRVGDPQQYTAQYIETTDDNIATLTVWANYYVDGEYHHRERLFMKDFAKSTSTNAMYTWLFSEEGLAQTRDKVFGGGANSGYQWTPQSFYNYYGDAEVTKSTMYDDGDKNVYIKVTSTKDMEASVMLYVHLKQTETIDRIIAMPGYTAGDYVSYSAVKTAVKTKYTGSSMTVSDLYTESDWDRLMDGQKATGAASVKVEDNGITKIHVIVKNASSKSSATKDPTNPATGDNILFVVGTMTVAAVGLAAIVVLKKRKKI